MRRLLPRAQVSEHLDIGRDESDEAKVEALSAVHAVGDALYVKVRGRPTAARADTPATYTVTPHIQLLVQRARPLAHVSGIQQPVGVPRARLRLLEPVGCVVSATLQAQAGCQLVAQPARVCLRSQGRHGEAGARALRPGPPCAGLCCAAHGCAGARP